MTFDEFCHRIGDAGVDLLREEPPKLYYASEVMLRRVFDHLVATGADIGDVLRGEVNPMWLVMSTGDGTERGMTTTNAEERLKRDLGGRRMAVQALLSQEFGYDAAKSIAEFIWYRSEPKPDLSELRELLNALDLAPLFELAADFEQWSVDEFGARPRTGRDCAVKLTKALIPLNEARLDLTAAFDRLEGK